MPSDIVLDGDQVRVTGTRLMSVGTRDESTDLRVSGWLHVASEVVTPQVGTHELTVGLGAPGEPKPPGTLAVAGRTGDEVFEVDALNATVSIGSRQTPGRLRLHMPDGSVATIGHGRVTAPQVVAKQGDFGEVVAGAGAPGEPKDAGSLQIRDRDGTITFAVDGATGEVTDGPIATLLARVAELERRVAELES